MSEPVYLCSKCGLGHTSASCAPREFWIIPSDRVDIGKCYDSQVDGSIKVIGFAEYDALKAEHTLMRECLTYIGNGQTRMYLAQEFARACLAKLK